ncbi:TetR/AcrR family transcriptional regulator [Desulfospira joergensenii]|uniref:TetR/AcrR family transcriptional regulator n=1 Tax=Desulfospira joergensenii TaxID=53329 RepID=UPI0004061BBC|nr:TetR/AcrR family transcriptional regulator [Desulfospira joergensenii]
MGKAEETRLYIIERAAPIFNKYGYEGTSMSRLTEAINMTKGAIYGNFKNKDEIALAVFDYNFNKFLDKASETVLSKKHACDKLIALAGFYLDKFSVISGHGGCPILNAAVDSDNAHSFLKKKVVKVLEIWMNSVIRIIQYGIKHKQIHRNTRPEQFASVFVSLIEGGLMLSKVTGNTIHLSRNIDHIIHLVNTELRI